MQTTLPPLYPPALSRPAGRERELTAVSGQRFELKKYKPCGLYLTVAFAGAGRQRLRFTHVLSLANLTSCPLVISQCPALSVTSLERSRLPIGVYVLTKETRPNMAVSSFFRPAGREKAGVESGGKVVGNWMFRNWKSGSSVVRLFRVAGAVQQPNPA